MTWVKWLLGVVAVGLAACGGSPDRLPQLQAVGDDLLRAAAIEALPGGGPATVTVVRDKDTRYVVVVGVVAQRPQDAPEVVVESLRRTGFVVVRSGADGATAVRDDLVAQFTLADRLGESAAVPGTTLVQLRLAVRDPQLAWTQV